MKIKIYVSNLSKYLNGSDNGEWVTLPASEKELEHVKTDIIGEDQEWIILDYAAPFTIGEYDNLEELQDLILGINDYDIEEPEIKALFKAADTKEEAVKSILNGEYTIINTDEIASGWSVSDQEEINGLVLNECGYVTMFEEEIPEELVDYINWAQIWTAESINCGWEEVTVDNITYLVRL